MTSVIVWLDLEKDDLVSGSQRYFNGGLWIAADSRISSPSDKFQNGRQILTDVAPKILPVPYTLYRRHEDGPGSVPVYNGELGFAYAGNTLPANMTYGLIMSALAGSTGEFYSEYPTMEDFVKFVTLIGSHFAREAQASFEAFLTGTCPQDPHGGAQVWHLLLWSQKQGQYHKCEFSAEKRMFLLGNRKAELREMCRKGFALSVDYNPTKALRAVIKEEGFSEVGGLVTIAKIERQGGITLFPRFGPAAAAGDLPGSFSREMLGKIGDFEVGTRT
ncbi:hypothetical protein WJS89_02825 [Sphingomicrobium sp. XHP0235]|uniref:hypothetical protein n=1 Tax=Sphingomicrobium aquimarinum TaxID=3133971 RepID=UPI0031FF3794